MNERVSDFLFELAQQPPTASIWYPSTIGSLDPALLEEDVEILGNLEAQELLILSHPQERNRRLIGIRVELTDSGRAWALGLKG